MKIQKLAQNSVYARV